MSAKLAKGHLTESMEMYLKTILLLQRRWQVARVRDIAESLDVSMPSVTSALKALKKRGLIQYDRYEYVQLSEGGRSHAESLLHKCEVMGDFLSSILGVEEGIAKSDACLMEHVVSEETIGRLVNFMKYVDEDNAKGGHILSEFRTFLKRKKKS